MVVYPDQTFYTQVKPRDVKTIVAEHIIGGKPVEKILYHDPASEDIIEKWYDIGFYGKQQRILLENCGVIDPENIDHYRAKDGYQALYKVLTEMTPEEVIEEVLASGVRGRGGAGFPAGLKWRFARKTQNWPKYVICNADEGDPGAFMDRSVLEGDPHSSDRGDDHCRLCHRRRHWLHLLPGRVPAGHQAAGNRPGPGPRTGLVGREYPGL